MIILGISLELYVKVRQGLEYRVEVISGKIVKGDTEFRQRLVWYLTVVSNYDGFDDVSNGGKSIWS